MVPADDAWVPTLAGVSWAGGRFDREIRDLFGVEPRDHPLPRRMVRHGHWPTGWYPLRRDAGAVPGFPEDVGSYPFVHVEGPGVYEIPVGSGARRADRARALPVLGGRRDDRPDEGPAVVRAPRCGEALRGTPARGRDRPGRADQRRHGRGPRARLRDGGGAGAGDRRVRARPGDPGAAAGAGADPQPRRGPRRHRQRRRLRHRQRPRTTAARDPAAPPRAPHGPPAAARRRHPRGTRRCGPRRTSPCWTRWPPRSPSSSSSASTTRPSGTG